MLVSLVILTCTLNVCSLRSIVARTQNHVHDHMSSSWWRSAVDDSGGVSPCHERDEENWCESVEPSSGSLWAAETAGHSGKQHSETKQ